VGLLYTPELAARAAAWAAQPLNAKRSADGLTELGAIWSAIHRLPPVECRQCQYSERNASVAAYLRDFSRLSISSTMSDSQTASKYQIAPAYARQTFVHDDLSAPVTAENLTDDLAEFFIKHGRKDAFIERGSQPAAEAGAPAGEKSEGAQVSQADLDAEKEAHKATKKELTEVSKQLAEAEQKLAAAADATK
jgi:hypothetical protein